MFKEKCCKQCGQVKFMGTMAKWPVQKHTEQNTEYTKTQQTLGNKYFVLCKHNNIFDDTTTFNLLTCICVFTILFMNPYISKSINIHISNMHIVFSY